MADTTAVKYVYPPNFDGFFADNTGLKMAVIKITGESDGTGETGIIKVNKSELKTTSGDVPAKLVVKKIDYIIHGLTATLEWDTSPHEVIAYLNGGVSATSVSGTMDFSENGGLVPSEDGGTGDIILTTTNADSGDTYDITITIGLKD